MTARFCPSCAEDTEPYELTLEDLPFGLWIDSRGEHDRAIAKDGSMSWVIYEPLCGFCDRPLPATVGHFHERRAA